MTLTDGRRAEREAALRQAARPAYRYEVRQDRNGRWFVRLGGVLVPAGSLGYHRKQHAKQAALAARQRMIWAPIRIFASDGTLEQVC